MEQFDLIVIGAGISGIAIAARAAASGLSVAVVEQHATVAQGASFVHSGWLLPSPLDGWFGPGPVLATRGGALWRRRARASAADTARLARYTALGELIALSRDALQATATAHALDYEGIDGGVYLFRSAQTQACAAALAPALTAAGIAHRFLDAPDCRALEPALAEADDLSGAMALAALSSGNCALAAKRLKAALTADTAPHPVCFLLARRATRVAVERERVCVDIEPARQAAGLFSGVQAKGFVAPSTERLLNVREGRGAQRIAARHVVVAAGTGATALLATAGVAMPLQKVTHCTLTGLVMQAQYAPRQMLVDADRGVGIVRIGQRVRAGIAIDGEVTPRRRSAIETRLYASIERGIPGVARLDAEASIGEHMATADGLPVVGALPMGRPSGGTPASRLLVALGASHRGWGLTFGAADIIVASITGDAAVARWEAFSPARFR